MISPILQRGLTHLYAPGLSPAEFAVRATALARDYLGCDFAALACFDPRTRRLELDYHPFDPALRQAFAGAARHLPRYPAFRFDPLAAGGAPFFACDFMTRREYLESDIYREGFQQAHLSDRAFIPLPTEGRTHVFVTLERTHGAVFRESERALLRLLQPHLANAHALGAAALQIQVERALTPAVFSSLGFTPRETETLALVVLDRSNAEIAATLRCAPPAVSRRLRAIMDRLGVNRRPEIPARLRDLVRRKLSEPAAPEHRISFLVPRATARPAAAAALPAPAFREIVPPPPLIAAAS